MSMFSYWEKQSFVQYDFIVIGSGIVGLSTALSIKDKAPSAKVLVLERGILPTGASTKNAGFACIGSLTEILDDMTHMSKHDVLSLVEMRLNGLKKLRSRLGDTTIGYAENGSYELIPEADENCLNQLDSINQLLKPVVNQQAFSIENNSITAFGFNPSYTKHLIRNNCEGELHTGKMMRALIDLCLTKGIEIKTGCHVADLDETETEVRVSVDVPAFQQNICFTAPCIAVCTNAFAAQLLPDYDVIPGRGQVLITKPVSDLKFKGIFHFEKGFYYFREIDGRVLFGGGRNIDFKKETSTEFEINEAIFNDLTTKLSNIILPGTRYEIDSRWTGIMAFGSSKFPIINKHSERITVGVRMGGMGIAIGSEAGEKIADLLMHH